MLAKDVPARPPPKEVFNGVDIAVNARFGKGGVLMGGVTLGRTASTTAGRTTCQRHQVSTPGTRDLAGEPAAHDGFCNIQSPLWNGVGSQVKLQAVYPLPWDFVVSGTFKHLPGIPDARDLHRDQRAGRAALGRDLATCRGAVPRTAYVDGGASPVVRTTRGTSAAVKHGRAAQPAETCG